MSEPWRVAQIDGKGRCCGRKPLGYQRHPGTREQRPGPFKFCTRCNRAFDATNGEQIANWAWANDNEGRWVRRRSVAALSPDGAREESER